MEENPGEGDAVESTGGTSDLGDDVVVSKGVGNMHHLTIAIFLFTLTKTLKTVLK